MGSPPNSAKNPYPLELAVLAVLAELPQVPDLIRSGLGGPFLSVLRSSARLRPYCAPRRRPALPLATDFRVTARSAIIHFRTGRAPLLCTCRPTSALTA